MKVRSADELMRDNLLVKHLGGSHAYGTSLPSSDVDYRGIFCADPVNVRTPFFPVRECEDQNEDDTKFYELAHFMKLCLDCNPNIVETLWVADEDITYRTPAYDLLRSHRKELLSSKVAFTFSGYALSQLKRIKGHNKWLTNPQSENPPVPRDFVSLVQNFGLGKTLKFNPDEWNAGHRFIPFGGDLYGVYTSGSHYLFSDDGNLNTQFDDDREKYGAPILMVRFDKDQYKAAKEKWDQYWTWKRNRNVTRSELEEQFGYDTKHAMHLVRLLRMGVEILTAGEVIVKRPDAQELLEIRAGAWDYDELVKYAEDLDNTVRGELYTNTLLPKKPDIKFAAQLLMGVQDLVWSSK